jgi:hypothetical protein
MKLSFLVFCALISSSAFAQDILLDDFNYTVPDIARRGLTKETVFKSMERNFIKLGSSICSNRALIWAHDMKRNYGIDSAKLFLFYSDKTGEAGDKVWWYHVTPMVNEKGTLWTVDAGFPSFVRTPLLKNDWFKKFAGSTNCKELKKGDDALIEKMFTKRRFPSTTPAGTYDCYYTIVPAPYWTPSTVAQGLLERNRDGEPGNYERTAILSGELMQACKEASTGALGGIFGGAEKKCLEYLGL